jgi:SAM-dependent methyltransferase
VTGAHDDPRRSRARDLAAAHLARGDAKGWFEALYAEAAGETAAIPWADLRANVHLVEWLDREAFSGAARRALVAGCGLGDDAELLRERGFDVTAFDVSPTAVAWCRRRFPNSSVRYETADLLEVPAPWRRVFDLVVEIYTLQVLPAELRPAAMTALADCVRPGGRLLVVCRGRGPGDDPGQMPWKLLAEELSAVERAGLSRGGFEDFDDHHESPPVRRFRASFARPE